MVIITNSFLFYRTNQTSFLKDANNSLDLSIGVSGGECLSKVDDQSVVSESLSMNVHQLNKTDDLESTLERNSLLLSQSSLTLEDDQALSGGSYMGLFTKDIKGIPLCAHSPMHQSYLVSLTFKPYKTVVRFVPTYSLVMRVNAYLALQIRRCTTFSG